MKRTSQANTGLLCGSIRKTILMTALLPVILASIFTSAWADPTFVNAANPTLPSQARGIPKGGALTVFDLDLDSEGTVTLELERFSVFSDDASFTLVTDTGATDLDPPDDVYFRGWANHDPNSVVMLAFSEDGTSRGVITGSNGAWLLESHPGRGLVNRKVDAENELSDRSFSCGAEPSSAGLDLVSGASEAGAVAGIPTNVTATAHIIVDTDYEYLQDFGFDAAAAIAYLGDLFAYSSGLYEREIDTNLLVIAVRLFSTNHDPYELMNAGCGGEGALDEVQDEWSGNSTPRTLVHLVSGKNVGQGCAYVGVLCHQSNGYGASMGIGGNFNIDNPDVIWDNMVIAHEIGHNFNSPHTHNYCGIAGIDDPVDKCVVSGDPDNVGDSCTASNPALPGPGSLTGGTAGDGNGTVMSYCHFRTGGFGNFSWTFGEFHPDGIAPFRVSDRMRAHVADNTSCMALEYTGPDLQVFKDCKPDDPLLVGETGLCTIVVENRGTEIALGVVTEDLFVSHDTFSFGAVTATKGDDPMDAGTCTTSSNPQDQSGDVSCELGDLDIGHKVTIRVEVTADSPQNVNDRVTVTSDSPDPNTANNVAEDTLTFIASADLAVTKLCKPDGDLLAGSDGVCSIVIHNLGPSDAENVHLVDTHVSNLPFSIDSVSPLGTCSIVNDVVTCNFASLAVGASRQVDVTIRENNPMDINDTASVSSDTSDPDTSNNTATDGLHIIGLADLSINKSDSPDPVVAGESLTYTLSVHNYGPSEAVNVVVTDAPPAGTTVSSVTPTSGTCNPGVPGDPAQPLVCTLGNIPNASGRSITIVLDVLPGTTGVLHNTATVTSDTLDDNQANNQASAETTVNVSTNLTNLVKTDDPDPVLAGAELKYLVTLTNDGPSTATGVQLVDTLPSETSLLAFEVLGGADSCVHSGLEPDTITCAVGNVGPGESFVLSATVLVDPSTPDGTTITNHVAVSEDTGPGSEVSEDTLVETAADLWIDKTGSFITQNPGKNIVYTLAVHNDSGCSGDDPQVCGDGGPSDAQNVVVTDSLPSTSKKLVVFFVSEDCIYDEPSHSITCTTPTLAAGDSVTHLIEATPKGNLGTITNVAEVTSDTDDPNADNNSDELDLDVGGGGQKGNKD